MSAEARRQAVLTLDTMDDVVAPCRACVFWELDQIAGQNAMADGDPALEKEAWVSAALLEWGPCGFVVYRDEIPTGYVLYAPSSFIPRSTSFPTSPIGADAIQLVTARVHQDHRARGLGRSLIQAAAHDLARRGFRAIEAFGHAGPGPSGCLLPAAFLVSVGFKTIRPHRRVPRLRMDLRTAVTFSAEVEAALDRIVDAIKPDPALRPV